MAVTIASGDRLVIKLELDAGQFSAELDKEQAKLEELDAKYIGDKTMTIHVNVDDAEARARLAEDTKPEKKEIKAEGGGLGIGAILTALPGLSPLLAAASAGVMGLASAFAAAAAGAGGLAAVAIPTLKDVIQAAGQGAQGMKGLDAAERQAAQTFIQFQNFWKGFTASFEKPVLSMFTNGLKMLQQLLIDLRPVITAAAQAFTQLEGEAAKALGSPFWRQFFTFLGTNARPMLVAFGEAIGNLIKGFAGLLMAFQPLSTSMAQGLLTLTQRFAAWATSLQSSQGFHQFIEYVRQNGPLVVQLIGQLASIAGRLLVAWAPLGHQILQAAVALATLLNHLLTTNPWLGTLIGYLISGIGAFKLLGAAISPVSGMMKTFGGVAKSVGDVIGVLSKSGLPGLIAHMRQVSPVIDGVVKAMSGFGRFMGPILKGIGESFTVLGGVIRTFATGVVTAIRMVSVAMMSNPIIAIITAIVAVVAIAAYEIVTHWTQVRQFLINTWNAIKSAAESVWNGIKSFLSGVWNGIVSGAHALANGVVAAFQWMYNHNYYFQDLVDFIRRSWTTAQQVTLSVWNAIRSFLSSAWNTIRSVAMTVFNAVRSFITTVWNAVHSVTSSVWNAISGTLSAVWGRIRSVVDAGASAVRSVLSSAWNAVRSAAASAWNSIVSVISNAAGHIRSALSSLASQAFSWGRNLISSFVNGIQSMIGAVGNAVSNVAHAVARFLGFHSPAEEGPGAEADKWAPNLMKMFAQGIVEYTPLVQSALARAIMPPSVNVTPAVQAMVRGAMQAYTGAGGSGQYINNQNAPLLYIENLHVRNDSDIQKIQQALYNANQTVLRGMGIRQVGVRR